MRKLILGVSRLITKIGTLISRASGLRTVSGIHVETPMRKSKCSGILIIEVQRGQPWREV